VLKNNEILLSYRVSLFSPSRPKWPKPGDSHDRSHSDCALRCIYPTGNPLRDELARFTQHPNKTTYRSVPVVIVRGVQRIVENVVGPRV
jgi:hypothetical protein